jgi:hypothetical protein
MFEIGRKYMYTINNDQKKNLHEIKNSTTKKRVGRKKDSKQIVMSATAAFSPY